MVSWQPHFSYYRTLSIFLPFRQTSNLLALEISLRKIHFLNNINNMHLKNENNVCCFKWHSKFNMKRKTRSRRLFNKQLGHYQTKASSPRVYSNHAGILVKYSTLWFMPHPHTRLWIKSLNHRPKQKNTCQLYYVYVIIVI